MRRREFLKLSLSTAGLLACPWFVMVRAFGKDSSKEAGLPVLELSGTPRERGRIHGEECRSGILAVMAKWKDLMGRSYDVDPDVYIEEFVAAQQFTAAMQKYTPGLLEEVAGLAEGAGVEHDTMLAYQFVDEEWWYGRNRQLGISLPKTSKTIPAAPTKCSVCAAFGREGLPPIMGQNLDFFSITEGHHLLLRIHDDKQPRESFVLTYAGFLGANGLNSRSVAVCVNALLQLDQRLDGLPVAAVVRGVLEQPTFDEAITFVRTVRHASGQAYTVGGPDRIAMFECSANKVVGFEPEPGATRLWHTNHPIVNDDQSIYKERVLAKTPSPATGGPGISEIRYATFAKRLGDPTKPIAIDDIKAALGSHDQPSSPICSHLPADGRLGLKSVCTVMELCTPPVLHLSAGPPCSAPFKSYTFS